MMRLRKFPVSWDQIIGNHLYNRVTFDMNLLRSANAIESYYEIISRYQQIFDYVIDFMKSQRLVIDAL